MISENLLAPKIAVVERVMQESRCTKTFTLRFKSKADQDAFCFLPGRFVETSIFGAGEMPISISSSPFNTETFQLTVAEAGAASRAMHALKAGDELGIRGPYGKPFPVTRFKHKNVVLIAGGLGLAPLRPLLYTLLQHPAQFGKLFLFYGAKEPCEMIFRKELMRLRSSKRISVALAVEKPARGFPAKRGFVTELLGGAGIPKRITVAAICGPPAMVSAAIAKLAQLGVPKENIYASMERLMHCGIGKCAHCNIGHSYVCIDGPVFSAEELLKFEGEA